MMRISPALLNMMSSMPSRPQHFTSGEALQKSQVGEMKPIIDRRDVEFQNLVGVVCKIRYMTVMSNLRFSSCIQSFCLHLPVLRSRWQFFSRSSIIMSPTFKQQLHLFLYFLSVFFFTTVNFTCIKIYIFIFQTAIKNVSADASFHLLFWFTLISAYCPITGLWVFSQAVAVNTRNMWHLVLHFTKRSNFSRVQTAGVGMETQHCNSTL